MRISLFLWSVLASVAAAAGLTFPETQKDIKAAADATEVVVDFPFTNSTAKPVEIKRYNGDCSCVSAAVAGGKLIYQPGEEGVVRVKFDMSNLWGEINKMAYVFLDDDKENAPSVSLTIKVHIPEVVKVETKTVKWDIGAAATPQTIRLSVEGEEKVHILSVTSSNENFLSELKAIEDGRVYEVSITPKNTESPGLGIFRFETDCKIERHKYKQAFASISRPIPKPAPEPTNP
jgi:hypothetical protein